MTSVTPLRSQRAGLKCDRCRRFEKKHNLPSDQTCSRCIMDETVSDFSDGSNGNVQQSSLPPKELTDLMLPRFKHSVNSYAGLVDMPKFEQEYARAYFTQQTPAMDWLSMLLAMLACAGLSDHDLGDANYFCSLSIGLLSQVANPTPNSLQASLLIALYYVETHNLALGSSQIAYTARAAQIRDSQSLSGEHYFGSMQRIWAIIYALDWSVPARCAQMSTDSHSIVSLELNIPLQDMWSSRTGCAPPKGMMNIYRDIHDDRRSKFILQSTTDEYERRLQLMTGLAPPMCHESGNERALRDAPWCVHVARFLIARHNLRQECHGGDCDLWLAALTNCVLVAKDTAGHICALRARSNANIGEVSPDAVVMDWIDNVRKLAPFVFLCKHLWRCALVLCFHMDLDFATAVVEALALVGGSHRIAVTCSWSLRDFTATLVGLSETGVKQCDILKDSGMLEMASGDLEVQIFDHDGYGDYEVWGDVLFLLGVLRRLNDPDNHPHARQAPHKRMSIHYVLSTA